MSSSALFADLYEFTMLRAYFELGMTEQATFSLFVRNLPTRRNFLIACGLADLLKEIQHLRFESEQIDYLGSLQIFPQPFLDWLNEFRFSGDIYAMREGTPFFQNEPIIEVVAPIAEAQLIETLVLNQIGLQTTLASKAARNRYGGSRSHGDRFRSPAGARNGRGDKGSARILYRRCRVDLEYGGRKDLWAACRRNNGA